MCPHEYIEASLDRWTEAHWHIHQMEQCFHNPEPFRYSVNAFIRASKETPQLLSMELQNCKQYQSTIRGIIDQLYQDALFALLHQKRDFLVHRGMLRLHSSGSAGRTEGRGFKMGMSFPVSPDETSDAAYERFLVICCENKEFRQLFGPDEDSRPCIERTWKITELPNTDLLDVCVDAWRIIGKTLSQIVEFLGAAPLDLTMSCRHEPEKVRMKIYSQKEFFRRVDGETVEA